MRKYLEKVDYSNPENKHKMNKLFEDVMEDLKEADEEAYYEAKCELYEIAYGKTISDDMAERWVKNMKPLAKWDKSQVATVATNYGVDIPLNSAYVLFNKLYSDSKNIYGDGEDEESIMKYIEGAKDWYYDEDSKYKGEEKLYMYGKYVVGI